MCTRRELRCSGRHVEHIWTGFLVRRSVYAYCERSQTHSQPSVQRKRPPATASDAPFPYKPPTRQRTAATTPVPLAGSGSGSYRDQTAVAPARTTTMPEQRPNLIRPTACPDTSDYESTDRFLHPPTVSPALV